MMMTPAAWDLAYRDFKAAIDRMVDELGGPAARGGHVGHVGIVDPTKLKAGILARAVFHGLGGAVLGVLTMVEVPGGYEIRSGFPRINPRTAN